MSHSVTEARLVRGLTVWIQFAHGTEGEVDLAQEIWDPVVFGPLKDPAYFQSFVVAEYGSLAWPNGADFAPEFLYSRAHVAA